MNNLVRKNILALQPYSSAREEYSGANGIFLDANENPYGTYNRYPDPYQKQLKKRLSKIKNILENQIFIGNGSDEVIDLTFRIFCEPNRDKALTFSPTYGMYEVAANINAVELIKVPLTNDFQIDTKKLIPYFADKTIKLMFICSPNNPTANMLNIKDIEFVLTQFKGIIIVDEAYIDFCDKPSFIQKINKYPNLIVSQTLSKAWGLAGLRVGLAFMNEKILSFYNKVKSPYNVNEVSQQLALQILDNEEDFSKNVSEILSERTKMATELQALNLVKKVYPSDANFLLVKVENADDIYCKLVEKEIIIRNRNSVIPDCIRITIGTPEENIKLINVLKEIDND
ncbi:MAG: histidinol-phosphate transaminase [Capnocytophaga sp.]|nr:histidinol-phosphate transaminase [Capnocytophaga sp.]